MKLQTQLQTLLDRARKGENSPGIDKACELVRQWREGGIHCRVPDVCTAYWSELDWIVWAAGDRIPEADS